MENSNRRSFIRKSAAAAAGVGLYTALPLTGISKAASDRVNIGAVGLGFGAVNMRIMMEANPFVHCLGLCDVDQVKLEAQSEKLKQQFPERTGQMKLYKDFRQLLDNKDIDGVIVAPPDHWHTYIYAAAIKSGKAVYVEKPVGKTIAECELMVDLQKKYKNVVTCGLWHISVDYFVEAFKILRSGVLGDVYKAHAWITGGTDPIIYPTDAQEAPETLDYQMWLGPAPSHPYVSDRVSRWRYYWDYGGGKQTDWVHYLDSALDGLAALGYERRYPNSVYSVGYKHAQTMRETPSIQTSVFQFDRYHIVWEQQVNPLYGRGDGVAWIGSNGTLVCNRTGYEIIPERGRDGKPLIEADQVKGSYANQYNHVVNWAACIRDNNSDTNCPIDKGAYATILANAANVSYRIGSRSVEYLPEYRRFRNDREADAYMFPNYQHGWQFPNVS